jgi:hypothetical protein
LSVSLVVVAYEYSTSSDRVLNKKATWKGELPGQSLATVMSELRRLHPNATNIDLTKVEWLVQAGPGSERLGAGSTWERRAPIGGTEP